MTRNYSYPTEPYVIDEGDPPDVRAAKAELYYLNWQNAGRPKYKYSSPENEKLVTDAIGRVLGRPDIHG